MRQDKIILFDWGNIVESNKTGYTNIDAWKDLFKACGYDDSETLYCNLWKYRFSCIKDINEFEEVYKQIKDEYNLKTNFNEFVDLYNTIFDKIDYYKDVRDYEVSLKDRCYIGILSDLTIFDKKRIDKQLDLSQYDYVFLSFEMGLKKPEIQIYEEVQKQLPFKRSNILFIDDRSDNIETAKNMGWKVFQATGLELDKIKNKCEEFLNE